MRMMLAAATTAALLTWAGAAEAEEVRAEDHPCREQIDYLLKHYGLSLDEMQDTYWYSDYFAERGGRVGEPDGHRFYGRPPSCKDGNVAIELYTSCHIDDVYSQGDCRVKGIPHVWW